MSGMQQLGLSSRHPETIWKAASTTEDRAGSLFGVWRMDEGSLASAVPGQGWT